MNSWAIALVRYSGPFLNWTREDLKQMDQRTRKLMAKQKALHHRDDVNRLYVPSKEGGRGLTSIEDCLDASIQRLEDYIQKHRGRLITAIRNNTENERTNRTTITRKQKWEGRKLYERFKRLKSDISKKITWTWQRKENNALSKNR